MSGKLFSKEKTMQKYLYKDLYKLEDIHWWHKAKRRLVSYFLKNNIQNRTSKILDVGCGTGKNLEVFSQYGKVFGIDNSSEAIAFCKKRGHKNIRLGNIEKLPYKKNTFSAITALDVLEHVDDNKALLEIDRVLRPDGLLIATVPAFNFLWSKWDEVLYHKRRYTKDSLTKTLKKNNFKIVKISYIYSFLLIPALLIRSLKNIFYKDYYPSDFILSNKVLNSVCGLIADFEKIFIINFKIPFGTSLIVVAEKSNE